MIELGCGTGEITRALAPHAERIDAIDVSRQMIEKARSMPGGDHPAIRWIVGRAEEAPLEGPYALAVAGASLHWMDWDIVLPRIGGRWRRGRCWPSWSRSTRRRGPRSYPLIRRYSAIQNWENADLIGLLEGRRVFKRLGEKQFDAEPYQRTVEEYIDGLHATSGLARDRMGAENVRAFDEAVRALVAPHAVGGVLELAAAAEVTWGSSALTIPHRSGRCTGMRRAPNIAKWPRSRMSPRLSREPRFQAGTAITCVPTRAFSRRRCRR